MDVRVRNKPVYMCEKCCKRKLRSMPLESTWGECSECHFVGVQFIVPPQRTYHNSVAAPAQ